MTLKLCRPGPHVCSATLGVMSFSRLLVADTPWSRLRGWYGYAQRQQNPHGLDAVLITQTGSIHTIAMRFAMDLFWLDKGLRCIGWQLNVRPWRCSWHMQAAHVLERPATANDRRSLQLVWHQPLKMSSAEHIRVKARRP